MPLKKKSRPSKLGIPTSKRLKAKIDLALGWMPEPPRFMVPSFALGTDGPYLESVFIISRSLICEVLAAPEADHSFDFCDLSTISSYRVQLSTHKVAVSEEKSIEYEIGKVTLLHNLSPELNSTLNYAGDSRERWLELVKAALPVTLVLESLSVESAPSTPASSNQ